jgi:2-polyprenyl-3-methyl-5-hydroxy-6-metoxy-1,4-benzoquinol methylase
VSSILVRVFGWPATLVHGDTLVLDRWLWLRNHLPETWSEPKNLLDVGCGSGAFTIGSARRGYRSLGLSWDKRNLHTAETRARLCKAHLASFEVQDARHLDQRTDLHNRFDVLVSCENIEHILDDEKMMTDMASCLKRGGLLLLTTPNFNYRPITKSDLGPFSVVEDGGHVRKGYTPSDLLALCTSTGFEIQTIDYCSGFLSQKITALMRVAANIHPAAGWFFILPLRILPPLFDPMISWVTRWPGFSITLVAVKA